MSFFFEESVLTLMLSGHKTIVTDRMTIEFFPNTFFIPEKNCLQTLVIPNASTDNPTKCLVLRIDKAYQERVFRDLQFNSGDQNILYNNNQNEEIHHFMSNDIALIENLTRLYQLRKKKETKGNEMICTLFINELLLRVYQTKALLLLKEGFGSEKVDPDIQKTLNYIKNNFNQKITVKELASISGLGLTSYTNKFKACLGETPIEYVFKERINQAKILIRKDKMKLKEIAYNCGFNSYEYFCTRFKKVENIRPSEFKNKRLGKKEEHVIYN